MSTPDVDAWLAAQRARIEDALAEWVPSGAPAGLGEVMRYAVLGGGKRLRPVLTLAAAEAVGGAPRAALRAACAVELIHAYSLMHDDLPCMDDDSMRRGKPAAHVRFGEARALLAGDALQALAFELLTPDPAQVPRALQAVLCGQLARAAGHAGMAGGQAIDLASVGRQLSQEQLQRMHEMKTGALLRASVNLGVACAERPQRADAVAALDRFGAAIGLAFQVVDDWLDVAGETRTLGKTAGKDARAGKPTYVSLLGLDRARTLAQHLLGQAHDALDASGLEGTARLRAIAERVVQRMN